MRLLKRRKATPKRHWACHSEKIVVGGVAMIVIKQGLCDSAKKGVFKSYKELDI